MHVDTVRTFINPRLDATGTAVLDQLYDAGIMVVMTVDDAINDLTQVQASVNFYKDHPAILMWSLGSEWNINRYFTNPPISASEAADRTQTAASLIKSLDANHPVTTSYGDIDADVSHFVNDVCTSVDVWGLNIYRGNTFGTLFDQWSSISGKPMFIGEFGTDAFRSANFDNPPAGTTDGTAQAQWDVSEWIDLFKNLSAKNPAKVALGGFAFEWNDEWWKVSPFDSQQTGGFVLMGAHPDSFFNEEYFGIVDIDRQTRSVYNSLATAFDLAYQPPHTDIYRAVSRGGSIQEYNFQNGVVWFFKNGAKLYQATGGGGGGRGFNVAAIDPCTGALRQPVQHFDTWATRNTGSALCDMTTYLDSVPNGTLLIIAVADEAGLNDFPPNNCAHLSNSCIEPFFQKLEQLGGLQIHIRTYCYWNSWAMVLVKGEGLARQEQLGNSVEASVQTALEVPASISTASRSFAASGGNASVSLTVPAGCNWSASTNDTWINVNTPSGSGSGAVNYTVAVNAVSSRRTGSITIAGQTFTVLQGAAFLDVPANYLFYDEIGKLSARGITVGCGSGNYCPEAVVTREQMAAFVIRAIGVLSPAAPAQQRFNDVPPSNQFYAFIEQMGLRQITVGCGGNNYCPSDPVPREQMAAFILRALGEHNPPDPASQRFQDVPPSNPFYVFIERMAQLQITLGCSTTPPQYCPASSVTRGQMAAFLVRAFGL